MRENDIYGKVLYVLESSSKKNENYKNNIQIKIILISAYKLLFWNLLWSKWTTYVETLFILSVA
jgi:hypothetical protein